MDNLKDIGSKTGIAGTSRVNTVERLSKRCDELERQNRSLSISLYAKDKASIEVFEDSKLKALLQRNAELLDENKKLKGVLEVFNSPFIRDPLLDWQDSPSRKRV